MSLLYGERGLPVSHARTGLTRGDLSCHLNRLETSGYVAVTKEFVNKLPRIIIRLTGDGRAAFQDYRRHMKQMLDSVPD